MKTKKIIKIIISIILIAIIYLFLPYFSILQIQGGMGDLEHWKGIVLRTWDNPTSLGFSPDQKREPQANDIVFYSDKVIHLTDDLYMIGCYGVTDWGMLVYVLSRRDFYICPKIIKVDSYVGWTHKIVCKEANNNPYVSISNQFSPSFELLAYIGLTTIPSPTSIEDGKITFLISGYKDTDYVKEVIIDVETDFLLN